MAHHHCYARILACAGMIFILAGCITPKPSVVATAAPTTSATAAVPATPIAVPTQTTVGLTATVPATVTPTATASATAAPATGAPLITAQNAAGLTATALTLPDYPGTLLWPGADVPLPAAFSSRPGLVLRSGSTLYPVQLDPPSLGSPAPLPFSGDQDAFSPDLSSVLAFSQNGPATLSDFSGKALKTLAVTAPYGAAFSPDSKLVVVTSGNELAAFLFDVASGKEVAKLTGFQTAAPVYSVGIVPGNQYIYWLARANLELQEVKTGTLGPKLSYQDFIGSIAFTPDGQRLVVYVASNLYLYSLPDLKELTHLTLSQPATSLSISPDGRLLAASYGPGIKLFDLGENHEGLVPVASLNGPNDSTTQVAFSPDGRYLVSVHNNNIIEIWKAP